MPNHVELLNILLKNRGILDREKFLNPSYENHLYDPYLLKDMDKTVSRIFEAVNKNEKIIIYTDYDCDGIPSAVIMHDFFNQIGFKNFSIYIPDRHDEGYGLHKEAITQFIKDKIDLLITFDLGITSIEETILAKGSLDIIIVDHHLPSPKGLPDVYAIIDPKQVDCNYPDEMLCAAGLTFKLVQALIERYDKDWKIKKGWEKWLLDMAGFATLADQVPLVNENRVLAYYGLKVLRKTHRSGLLEIFRKSGIDISKLNEEDITFTLAPRINAASRMGNPMIAFEALSTSDDIQAKTLALHLVKMNDERKHLVAQIMKEVKKNLSKRILNQEEELPVVVIGSPKWRVGILGIIAAKITEEYKKPAFVWGYDGNDVIHGSCRSYGGVNLVKLMSLLPADSLIAFGGHKMAGGFSVSKSEIHFLEERLISIFKTNGSELLDESKDGDKASQGDLIDATIDIDDVNNENYKVIEQLAPFGVGNPKPIFILKDAKIYSFKEFGKDKNHLEVVFKNSQGYSIKAIAFFKTNGSFNNVFISNKKISLIVNIEKNTFAGRTELRLRIIDII